MITSLPSRCRTLAVLAVALVATCCAIAETLRIRADPWMPYNGDATAPEELPGYVVEILKKIFEPQDCVIDYRNLAWGEALQAAGSGEIEGVIGANRQEAAGLVLPAEPIGAPRVGLFVRKGSTCRYDNVPSLTRVRLGVILDYKYWDALDHHVATHEAPRVTKFTGDQPLRDAIRRLEAGDLDVVAESAPVFAWTLRELGRPPVDFPAIYRHDSDPIYVAFASRDGRGARYARLFDEGLRRLRKSGELATILARYGQLDWAE